MHNSKPDWPEHIRIRIGATASTYICMHNDVSCTSHGIMHMHFMIISQGFFVYACVCTISPRSIIVSCEFDSVTAQEMFCDLEASPAWLIWQTVSVNLGNCKNKKNTDKSSIPWPVELLRIMITITIAFIPHADFASSFFQFTVHIWESWIHQSVYTSIFSPFRFTRLFFLILRPLHILLHMISNHQRQRIIKLIQGLPSWSLITP